MNAATLVEDLQRHGVRLRAQGEQLIVDAPRGLLTPSITSALASEKAAVLRIIATNDRKERATPSLAEVAADRLPSIRFTIRETGDTKRDFDLVARVRQVIQEFQPGGNHVYLNIVTLDGRRVLVEWRALADRDLRIGIAHVLASAASLDVTQ